MTEHDTPEALVNYFIQRQTDRNIRAADIATALTKRERALIRNTAVMGWIQGTQHHDLPIPPDCEIVDIVIGACLSTKAICYGEDKHTGEPITVRWNETTWVETTE